MLVLTMLISNLLFSIQHHSMGTMRLSKGHWYSEKFALTNIHSLAISRMFGGFPSSFYTTYHSLQSKSEPVDQYPLRSDLYELFHYLNHTVLFGVRQSRQNRSDKQIDIINREGMQTAQIKSWSNCRELLANWRVNNTWNICWRRLGDLLAEGIKYSSDGFLFQ